MKTMKTSFRIGEGYRIIDLSELDKTDPRLAQAIWEVNHAEPDVSPNDTPEERQAKVELYVQRIRELRRWINERLKMYEP